MKVTFLGTGCMFPTIKRNHSGIFLRYKEHGLLFDCGENIQKQFILSDEKTTKVTKIFLTHWHGDHVYGLPGLLDNISSSDPGKKIEIYSYKGTKKQYLSMLKAFPSHKEINVVFHEVKEGVICDEPDFFVEAYLMNHTIPTLGFRFVEKDKRKINVKKAKKLGIPHGPVMKLLQKGKDVVIEGKHVKNKDVTILNKGKIFSYISDTKKCPNMVKVAKNSDLFVCESTFASDLAAHAKKFKHMTSVGAAEVAKKAKVKKLILTHFSQRYKTVDQILKEAKKVFRNTITAEDFMVVEI